MTRLTILPFLILLTAGQNNGITSEHALLAAKGATITKQIKKQELVAADTECDSLRIKNFKANLKEQKTKITSALLNQITDTANNFIKQECRQDTLFCDEIYLKGQKHYHSAQGYNLFSFAFAFKNSVGIIEPESANFFVFGIQRDKTIIFNDVMADLVGEIQLELSGFEIAGSKMIVWGEMYPYFSSPEYGKFKLTIDKHIPTYEFECKASGH